MTQTQNQQQYYYLHGYISVAIFWEHHQIQAFRDFERGKLGSKLPETGVSPHIGTGGEGIQSTAPAELPSQFQTAGFKAISAWR
jgi:hypothetical protein